MRNANGFNLVELMITLAIGAIIMTLAVPSMRSVIINNRITTQTNELVSALNMARMEAIRRGTEVSVCASADKATCSDSDDWSTGWIVLADANTTGLPSVSEILRTWDALPGNPTLDEAADITYVRYLGTGYAELIGATRVFTLKINGCVLDQARSITISPAGRVSTVRTSC